MNIMKSKRSDTHINFENYQKESFKAQQYYLNDVISLPLIQKDSNDASRIRQPLQEKNIKEMQNLIQENYNDLSGIKQESDIKNNDQFFNQFDQIFQVKYPQDNSLYAPVQYKKHLLSDFNECLLQTTHNKSSSQSFQQNQQFNKMNINSSNNLKTKFQQNHQRSITSQRSITQNSQNNSTQIMFQPIKKPSMDQNTTVFFAKPGGTRKISLLKNNLNIQNKEQLLNQLQLNNYSNKNSQNIRINNQIQRTRISTQHFTLNNRNYINNMKNEIQNNSMAIKYKQN